jgi:DNA polymerase-3 subunit epsilon
MECFMVNQAPFLFFDTETGGVDPELHSLFSIGMVVGHGMEVVAKSEIFIRHDPYVVSAGGLEVNRIDLVSHHKGAMEPMTAWEAMQDFLRPHFPTEEKIILVGHNISFDRAFLDAFLKSVGQDPGSRFSHRSIDTHAIAAMLKDAGRIPSSVALNSSGLFDHFQVSIPPAERHTALGDALGTYQLYWRMVDCAR